MFGLIKIVFFTSNRTKLAHLKHLGRSCGLDIRGFREKSFYATYHEPVIDNREQLLLESYRSALRQWRRINDGTDQGFFILEDTSVCIDALSRDKETPGVNVKYWMKGMTFRRMDSMLSAAGGDRAATVRSDIILHIPKTMRAALGIEKEFLWFVGETRGVITGTNKRIAANLVYPWLDSRTFNKWFIPNGFHKPFSALTVTEADSVDFRNRALQKVARFFEKIGLLRNTVGSRAFQIALPIIQPTPPVMVVCGFSCAGKTTLAHWMRDKYGFMHIEASDFMYQAFRQRHGTSARVKIGDFAEAALKHEPGIVAEAIADQVNARHYAAIVITGFRSPLEIDALNERLYPRRGVRLIFIDAAEDIRLDRALRRGRDNVTSQHFHHRDLQESRMGLKTISTKNAAWYIKNERTLPLFLNEFDAENKSFFAELSQIEKNLHVSRERELEGLILMALLDEQMASFTTTEIAEIINRKYLVTKSKNNVSRYFNQEFHPYYEIEIVAKKHRYRLSNTGESEARYLLAHHMPIVGRRTPQLRAHKVGDLFPID